MPENGIIIKLKLKKKKDAVAMADSFKYIKRTILTEEELENVLKELFGEKFLDYLSKPFHSIKDKNRVLKQTKRKGDVELAWRLAEFHWAKKQHENITPRYWLNNPTEDLRDIFSSPCTEIIKSKDHGYELEIDLMCGDEAPLKAYVLSLVFAKCGFDVCNFKFTNDLQNDEDWD
jgi:hypothetical protein